MRVIVLCTGRSGSTTFIRACKHIENFTAAHESAAGKCDASRFDFPDQHIEADNHLIWFFGELNLRFDPDSTLYVHLRRDREKVAESYVERWNRFARDVSIRSFAYGLLQRSRRWSDDERLSVARFFAETMEKNIADFLADKPRKMSIDIEDAATQFPIFWKEVSAVGDLQGSLNEFAVRHNPRPKRTAMKSTLRSLYGKFL